MKINTPVSVSVDRKALLLPLAIVVGFVSLVYFDLLFTRYYASYLDNHVHHVSYHLFFSRIFHGELPLWSYHHNGGTPIWPLIDLHNVFDPIVWLCYGLGFLGGLSSYHCFTLLIGAYLILFAMGAYCAARVIGVSHSGATLATIVAGCSFMSLLCFLQANGYLLHCCWYPWVLRQAIRFIKVPTPRSGLLLGFLTGMCFANYYAPLNLFVTAVIAIGALFFYRRLGIRFHFVRHLWSVFLGGLPFALGLIVVVLYINENFLSIARMTVPLPNSGYWDQSFFLPYFVSIPEAPFTETMFHRGHSPKTYFIWKIRYEAFFYAGTTAYLILALGALSWIVPTRSDSPRPTLRSLLTIAITALIGLAFIGGGLLIGHWLYGEKQALVFRNWRFLYPYVLLGLAILTGVAWDRIQFDLKEKRFKSNLAICVVLFVVTLLCGFHFGNYPYTTFSTWPALPVLARFGVPALLLFLSFKFLSKNSQKLFTAIALLLLLELGVFQRLWVSPLFPTFRSDIKEREPSFSLPSPPDTNFRRFYYPISQFAPYHKEGAAIQGPASFRMLVEGFKMDNQSYFDQMHQIDFFYPPASHWFRNKAQHQLLSEYPDEIQKAWGGVSLAAFRLSRCLRSEQELNQEKHLVAGVYLAATLWSDLSKKIQIDCLALPKPLKPRWVSQSEYQLSIESSHSQLLYVANSYDSYWKAYANGKPTPVYRANLFAKAIFLPKGTTDVILKYQPSPYLMTFILRTVWLSVFVAYLLFCLVQPLVTISVFQRHRQWLKRYPVFRRYWTRNAAAEAP